MNPAQDFTDAVVNDETGGKVACCCALVDEHQTVSVVIIYKTCCRVDRKRCAADNEHVGFPYCIDCTFDTVFIEIFFIKNNVRFYNSAAFCAVRNAVRSVGACGNKVYVIRLVTVHAVIAECAAVQFEHVFTAGSLMKTVDILCNNCLKFSCLFHLCQFEMCVIRFYSFNNEFFTVKTVEFSRICVKKASADDLFRRILPLLVVQTVYAAEIRNSAFSGNTCSAEKYYRTA